MAADFQVVGTNDDAPFELKIHRGEGMALLAMNWRDGEPPDDFVGFAIEYREPRGKRYYPLKNRLAFRKLDGEFNPNALSTLLSPIQKFRWVHFPRNAELPGDFTYRVTPLFMDQAGSLSYGEAQLADIQLARETHAGKINVAFTRGFVSSQAFVDRYEKYGPISELLPDRAKDGLDFEPTHPKAAEAYKWMGFEARSAIIEALDKAVADETASVRFIAFDLNLPEIVTRLEQLGERLRIIIDDSKDHGAPDDAETAAETRLKASAGAHNVLRQHMGDLQHNKMMVIDGKEKLVVCGSTNYSWRGFYIQSNNAVLLRGAHPVKVFSAAFDQYWDGSATFRSSASAEWIPLDLGGPDLQVSFSPHGDNNAKLHEIADDMESAKSSVLYSLAFLNLIKKGGVRAAVEKLTGRDDIFMYGISDRKVGGLDVQKPDGTFAPVYAEALKKDVPAPFSKEPAGGGGPRMHHKFVVLDFDTPDARVYTGSYNFSNPADTSNGENLLLIRDRRIVTAYMVEALRIFDHYHYRVSQQNALIANKELVLKRPPGEGERAWWYEDYNDARKIKDRELFSN
ncbi:phospholipase D-like domain-containing protein [Duganella radicis]|uniref:phospholipase D n=1 Tax=Duganella radicis TaxID=551988 RepID=A0A6L6PBG5_9BURK|nr:phospholipase D-like domain-containing protein [Duganella radicis]MTV36382.1 phospholipase [Duganella radicis]